MVNLDIKKMVTVVSLGLVLAACQPEDKKDNAETVKPEAKKEAAVKASDAIKEEDKIGYF